MMRSVSQKTLCEVAGGVTAGLGLIVMVGWFLHSEATVRTPFGFAPMYFNVALCLFLLGVGLIASVRNMRGVSLVAAALSGLIVLFTLLQSVFSVDLKIDRLFVEPFITAPGARFPGRMNNDGALTFLLASLGLLLFNIRRRRSTLGIVLSAWAVLIGVVALLIYALAYFMYEIEASRLAVPYAAAFVILGAGLILRGLQSEESQGADRGLRLKILLGYATALLLLIFVALASQLAVQRSVETERMVTQTLKARAGIEELYSYVKDIQRGQRGYVITGEESRLDPYRAGRGSVDAKVSELRGLITDAAQVQRLDALDALIQRQIQIQDRAVAARRENGLQSAIEQARAGEGEREMEEIHQQVLAMQQAQDELLRKRAELSRRIALLTGRINLAGILLAIAVLVVGLIVAFRGLRAREKAENDARELNRALEHRGASLAALNQQLTEVNRELEAFSYSVSHDLRAPLRGIDGFSQALAEDCADKLDEQGKDHLKRIRAAAQRMAALIDDMLSLSRVSRAECIRENVDLSNLAHSVAAELRKAEPERAVQVVIAPQLEDSVDPRLMRVVLENLLGNAWKFTARKEQARIEFGVTQQNGEHVYFVRDDGAGFNMEYASRLFGAFQRLHTDREFPGTGVGLATVQRIVHRHGGRVWAEGEVEKGAAFYFTVQDLRQEPGGRDDR